MVAKLLLWFLGFNTGDIYRDGAFAKTPGFSYKKDDTVIAVKTHHPFWDDNNGPDPSAPKGRYWERYVCSVVAYDQWSSYLSLFAYGMWILWTSYITFSIFYISSIVPHYRFLLMKNCQCSYLSMELDVKLHYLIQWKDRKSTRLNSSQLVISYAVFCLKKKKNKTKQKKTKS